MGENAVATQHPTSRAKDCAWCHGAMRSRYVRYESAFVCIACHRRRRSKRHTLAKASRWLATVATLAVVSGITIAVLVGVDTASQAQKGSSTARR